MDWNFVVVFKMLGKLNLFYGVIVGNMDLMVNCYIVDCKICFDDVYMLNVELNKWLDCIVIVYV